MLLLGLAAAATLVLELDLEADDGGLQPSSGDLQWQWGVPSTGPQGGFVGTRAWGTRLGEPYLNDAEGSLQLPAHDLSGLAAPSLSFWHWTEIDPTDQGTVEFLVDGSWQRAEPVYGYPLAQGYSGSTEGWELVVVDLSGLDDLSEVSLSFVADPSVQAAGWFVDEFQLWDGDVAPPRVSDLDLMPDTEDLDGPYLVSVRADDDVGLVSVDLLMLVDGIEVSLPASFDGDRWVAELPGQPPDTLVEYAVVAMDGANQTRLPAQGYESFRVRLPAPTGLSGPQGRVVDVQVELDWQAPDSAHVVQGYRVWREEELVGEVSSPPTVVEVLGDDVFEVSALYDVGEGDRSEPLVLDSARPRIDAIEPESVWQGESLTLEIEGSYLLLVEGDVDLDLGPGIDIRSIEVVDVDRCRVQLEVEEGAAIGPRDLLLSSGGVQISGDAELWVQDGSDRPALISLEPDSLTQGESGTLRLRASEPFEDLPLVELGEGVVVERVVESTDDTVLIDVVIGPTAPIGWRPVEADDGRRLLGGVEFRVRAYAPPVETCGHTGGSPSWLLLGLLSLLWRRSGTRAA